MLKISSMSGFQLNSVFSKEKGPSVLLFDISTRCFVRTAFSSNWKPLRGGAQFNTLKVIYKYCDFTN